MKTNFKLIGTGIVSALAASLCCITPILGLLAGTGGAVSSFSWLEPFRPYFICLTILVLGFAWYQNINSKKQIDCNCETEEKSKFFQSKFFLSIVTVLVVFLMTFPFYAHIFYSKESKQGMILNKLNIEKVEISISGMTCKACEAHINSEICKLSGIVKSNVSYEKGKGIFEYDSSKTNSAEIEKSIHSTGYVVINKRKLK
jgi:mercuric ion transport protein